MTTLPILNLSLSLSNFNFQFPISSFETYVKESIKKIHFRLEIFTAHGYVLLKENENNPMAARKYKSIKDKISENHVKTQMLSNNALIGSILQMSGNLLRR